MTTFRRATLPAMIASAVLVALPGSVAGPGPEHRTVEGSRIGRLVPVGEAASPRQRSSPVTPPPPPAPLGSPSASPLPRGTPLPPSSVRGIATWYRWRPGEAAAGPGLRDLLGPSWRGRTVEVRSGSRSVLVRLTDWCACPGGRIVDLDRRSFGLLASPSRGVLRVEVLER